MTWPDVGDTGYVRHEGRIQKVKCTERARTWRTWEGEGVRLRTNGCTSLHRPPMHVYQTAQQCARQYAIYALYRAGFSFSEREIGHAQFLTTVCVIVADLERLCREGSAP